MTTGDDSGSKKAKALHNINIKNNKVGENDEC